MIPILYDSSETEFLTNGIGRLSDCISCVVTEERNGIYECEFDYPITGVHYQDITEGRYISVTHDEQGDRQPFKIYHKSAPINGVVTFNAHHISYALSNVILSPFEATSVVSAFAHFETDLITPNEFTFWTDKASSGHFAVEVPTSIRSVLGGSAGSILDAFGGGEYEFDGKTVKLYQNRGSYNGVEIRYSKNLTGIVHDVDTLGLYNAVVGYYADSNDNKVIGNVVYGAGGISVLDYWTEHNDIEITNENGVGIEFLNTINQVVPLDLSNDFDEVPTQEQLDEAAQAYLNRNQPWIPKENIKVNFVALWQTEEYAEIAPLERVRLCDEVLISYPELGVYNVTIKVIKTEYNVLLDKYDSIELGVPKTSFAEVMNNETADQIVKSESMMETAIANATKLITGGLGGHVVFSLNAEGKPEEILIMDTENKATAVQVLRININGIGFSSNGVNGPFRTAWTLDGNFVADFITAGTMQANRIKGGTLTLGGPDNGNGTLVVYDANGSLIGEVNNEHFMLSYDRVRAFCGNEYTFYYNLVSGFTWQKTNGFNVYFNNPNGVRVGGITFLQNTASFSETIITPRNYYARAIAVGVEETDISTTKPTLAGRMTEYYDGITYRIQTDTGNANERFYLDCAHDHIWLASTFYSDGEEAYLGPGRMIAVGNAGMQMAGGGHYFLVDDAKRVIDGKTISVESSSAKRYKHAITDKLDDKLNPHRLYDLKIKQFVFNDDHLLQYDDMRGQTIPGFIAEEVDEIYPAATIHKADGEIESWDERRIIPPMLSLIQEQKKRIEELENRVDKLERVLTNMLKGEK